VTGKGKFVPAAVDRGEYLTAAPAALPPRQKPSTL